MKAAGKALQIQKCLDTTSHMWKYGRKYHMMTQVLGGGLRYITYMQTVREVSSVE